MSDERIPEARAASEEPAAIRAPAEQGGVRPADDGEAPRKRRRRGSRGGRNRRRPAAADSGGGSGIADAVDDVDLGSDRALTADDLAIEARADAELDGEPAPVPRPSAPPGRSRPVAAGEPVPEADGNEEA